MNESLSFCLLCFNDEPTIGGLVKAADEIGRASGRDYEILVVDDGSTDSSRAILTNLQKQIPSLRVIRHGKNLGYGAALRSAFGNARKDLVFYTDGDGQYDVCEVARLLPFMKEEVQMVNGYKTVRRDPFYRVWLGRAYQGLMRRLFRFRLRDLTCDFRLIRRSALHALGLEASSGAICLELVVRFERAGFRAAECAVTHHPRRHGRSQFFRWAGIFTTAREILNLYQALGRNGR